MRNFFTFIILSSFLSLPLYAHGPTRQQVVESVVINVPVDKAWELVGDFSGLHKWHPAIQSTEMKGEDVRILTLAPDKKVTEKLLKRNVEKKKLKYRITDMSVIETFEFAGSKVKRQVLPVNTYTGFLSVVREGEGSKVTWKGKFYRPYLLNPPTPEGMSDKDATGVMASVYRAGLDNLKVLLEEGSDKSASSATPKAPIVSPKTSEAPKVATPKVPTVSPKTPEAPKVATSQAPTVNPNSSAAIPSSPAAPVSPASPTPPATPDTVVSIKTKTTTVTKTKKADGTVTTTKTTTKTKTKTKGAFDPADPYLSHVKCKEGKKCKIDKFLLKGFRAFSQCQVCHGIDGNGSTIAPSLLDKLKKEVTYDIFIDRVTNGFKGQIGVMPNWKNNPNIMKNIENLYAYLKARADGIIPAGRLKKFKH